MLRWEPPPGAVLLRFGRTSKSPAQFYDDGCLGPVPRYSDLMNLEYGLGTGFLNVSR